MQPCSAAPAALVAPTWLCLARGEKVLPHRRSPPPRRVARRLVDLPRRCQSRCRPLCAPSLPPPQMPRAPSRRRRASARAAAPLAAPLAPSWQRSRALRHSPRWPAPPPTVGEPVARPRLPCGQLMSHWHRARERASKRSRDLASSLPRSSRLAVQARHRCRGGGKWYPLCGFASPPCACAAHDARRQHRPAFPACAPTAAAPHARARAR